MLVGSHASSAYGEPRATADVDIVIRMEPGDIPVLGRAFPEPHYYFNAGSAQEAIQHGTQFNIIHREMGHKVDFMIARMDLYGRHQIARKVRIEVMAGVEGFAASPEDIIINKMLFYREGGIDKHLRDIAGILKVTKSIDRAYIEQWLDEFEIREIWDAICNRLEQDRGN